MAFRRVLSQRVFSSIVGRFSCTVPPAPTPPSLRCERGIFQSAAPQPPLGLRMLDRFRLQGLAPLPPLGLAASEEVEEEAAAVPLAAARKLVRAAQMERLRDRLRGLERSSVPYDEFLRVCTETAEDGDGQKLARDLDHEGSVIVIGDTVVLRPDEIVKAIEKVIAWPLTASKTVADKEDDACEKQLKLMEEKKTEIDKKAEAQVQRELQLGLGFFAVQTLGFMRLTFWELSWDVMEPVCFFVASFYFMLGYSFYLRTSREPTFEGIFKSRFATKQRRLMHQQGFDLAKFEELHSRRAAGLPSFKSTSRLPAGAISVPTKQSPR